MRYIVTVEVKACTTQIVAVEASTENEAGLSAVAIVSRHAMGDIDHIDVLAVKEDPEPDRAMMHALPREGYIKKIL